MIPSGASSFDSSFNKPKLKCSKGKGTAAKSYKVREENFSPNTRHLAVAAKNHLHFKVAIGKGNAFPLSHADGHNDFIIKMIQDAAKKKYGGSLESNICSQKSYERFQCL